MTIQNQQQKKETIAFEAGSEYLNVITMRQSGSIWKGLAECLQNSNDSKATRIDVSITTDGFSVADNGFGFIDETHVDKYFAEVGFDHSEGIHAEEHRFGAFGLGRFQLASFAPVSWRSNTFEMRTDFLNHDSSSFEKTVGLEPFNGCVVSGKWYRPLSDYDVKQEIGALERAFTYFEVPVYINGIQLNPAIHQWDIETDDYKILFHSQPNRPVTIYNRGIKVTDMYKGDLHGAILVSKKNLMLNTARDNVLVAKCPIFKEASKVLRDKANEQLHTREYDSFKVRDFHLFINALLDGEFDSIAISNFYSFYGLTKYKVIPTPKGMVSIGRLLKAKVVKLFDSSEFSKSDVSSSSDILFVSKSLLIATNSPSLDMLLSRLNNKCAELFKRAPLTCLPTQLSTEECKNLLDAEKKARSVQVSKVKTESPLASLAAKSIHSDAPFKINVSHDDNCLISIEKDYTGRDQIAILHALSERSLTDIAETGFPALFELVVQAHATKFYKQCDSEENADFNVPRAIYFGKGENSAVNAHRKQFKYLSEQRRIAPQSY